MIIFLLVPAPAEFNQIWLNIMLHLIWIYAVCLSLSAQMQGGSITFKGDNSVKIVFAPIWKGGYAKS